MSFWRYFKSGLSVAICVIILEVMAVSNIQAEAPTFRLSDFSGGLNTKDGIFQVKPNQSTICTNFDLGITPGALTKRKGYEDVGYFDPNGNYATTGLVSIYSHYYRDGSKELFGIGYAPIGAGPALPAINWGRLFRSGNKRYIVDTAIFNYCYTGARWHWVSWKNNVILSNGRQRPLIWNGKTCRTLTIPAPGEPQIVPIDTTGSLNGEYRYMLRFATGTVADDTTTGRAKTAYISAPIAAYNEKVLLYSFPYPTIDSLFQTAGFWGGSYGDTIPDTIKIIIGRTKANKTDLDDSLIFYKLNTGLGATITIHKSKIDTLTYIDTAGDVSLGSVIASGVPTLDAMTSAPSLPWPKFGRPAFLERIADSSDAAPAIPTKRLVNPDTTLWGDSVLYVCYFTTYFDSVNQIESDSGRLLLIQPRSADDTMFYRLGIPKPPAGDSGLFRILYKGLMYRSIIKADTVIDTTDRARNLIKLQANLTRNILQSDDVEQIKRLALIRRYFGNAIKRSIKQQINVVNDTIMTTNFFPVAIIKSKDSLAYTDSLVWDSISTRQPYYRAIAPAHLNNVAYFKDRLVGSYQSRIYWSFLDSVGYWGQFENIALDLDDGDEITAVVPRKKDIVAFKNRNQYVLFPDDNGVYLPYNKWTENGKGCVAPFSVAWYNNALIYLDETGVYAETESPYKDGGSVHEPLSDPIANLIDYPISELKNAVGFVHRDRYWLSFPDKDSMYIYDFKTGGWSIYTYAFDQAVHYDTVSNAGLVPSSDMLFCRKNDSLIYKADTTYKDNGGVVTAQWQSQPIGISEDYWKMDKIGFWRGADADTGRVIIFITNEEGSTADLDTLNMVNQTVPRYSIYSVDPTPAHYYKLKLVTGSVTTNVVDSLVINAIDIWGKRTSEKEIR